MNLRLQILEDLDREFRGGRDDNARYRSSDMKNGYQLANMEEPQAHREDPWKIAPRLGRSGNQERFVDESSNVAEGRYSCIHKLRIYILVSAHDHSP